MKYLVLFGLLVSTPAFAAKKVDLGNNEVCIDGIKYHKFDYNGWTKRGFGFMAVAIDKETLKPIRCSMKKENINEKSK